jgi:predicted amidophosphoribosyltransferase
MSARQITDIAVQRAGKRLDRSVGYFLTNTVYLPKQTCCRCRGTVPLSAEDICRRCRSYTGPYTADLVGSLIYACSGAESGRLMRGYKEGLSIQDTEAILLLLLLGLSHDGCASAAVGSAFTHWASVPSLQHFDREHPLHRIIHQMPGLPTVQVEVRASEAGKAADHNQGRQFNAGHYDVVSAIPAGAHVLVIEDTWVSGGHAQSVAAAFKHAGADKVSILAIARWLDMGDPRTHRIYHDALESRSYDATVCPWLNEPCRPPAPIKKAEQRRSTSPSKNGLVTTSVAEEIDWGVDVHPLRCSLHGVELDHSGRCDACSKLTASPPARKPDSGTTPQKKPWWQFW